MTSTVNRRTFLGAAAALVPFEPVDGVHVGFAAGYDHVLVGAVANDLAAGP